MPLATSPAGTFARIHRDLPIFRMEELGRVIFYTPGRVLVAAPGQAAAIEESLDTGAGGPSSHARALARLLKSRGRRAALSWRDLAESPFEAECLTVYVGNQCNLACSYCHASPTNGHGLRERTRLRTVPEALVYAAAHVVARNAARRAKPLALVLHGGGEPTLHWDLLARLRARVEAIAHEHGTRAWAYIATNGVLSRDHASWLAGHFDLIGLSCDGPPEVQDKNRPLAKGGPTSRTVERTAEVLATAGARFHVRATITPATVRRQVEIAEYCLDRLRARAIRLEPLYGGRHAPGPRFQASDAEEFVECFLQARALAMTRGCDLALSGVRVGEIHGPYCNPLRGALQVTPNGAASACFLTTGGSRPEDAVMTIGRIDGATGHFVVDQERVAALRRRAARVPPRCEACVNVYHCVRQCPDACVIAADESGETFRCRLHSLLAHRLIKEMADHLDA